MDGHVQGRVFRCEAERVGDSSVLVTVVGELDSATSPELRDLLNQLRAEGISDQLILDLAECPFLDSTGLGVLVSAQRTAGARLNLVATQPELKKLLRLTALDLVFRVHATREAALESLWQQSQTASRREDGASRRL